MGFSSAFQAQSSTLSTTGWPCVFDSGGEDESMALVVDDHGNVTVTGYSLNETKNSIALTTIRYDEEGRELWRSTFQDDGKNNAGVAISSDNFGNLYILGLQSSTLEDFYNFSGALLVLKYTTNGEELWNRTFSKGKYIFPAGIAVDSQNQVVLTSWTGDDLIKSCWTLKIDSDGFVLWNQTYHEEMEDYCVDIVVTDQDEILVGGLTFEPGVAQLFLIQYNSTGEVRWIKKYGYDIIGEFQPMSITVDSYQNILIAGNTYSTSTYSYMMSVLKFDSEGTFIWDAGFDSGGTDSAHAVAVDDQDRIFIGGQSSFSETENREQCIIIFSKDGEELAIKRSGVQGRINDITIYKNMVFITGLIQDKQSSHFFSDKYVDFSPPTVVLNKPKEGYLYIFNRIMVPWFMPSFPAIIIFGKVDLVLDAENISEIERIEIYIDNELKYTIDNPPFEWIWEEISIKKHAIDIFAYDPSGCAKRIHCSAWKFF